MADLAPGCSGRLALCSGHNCGLTILCSDDPAGQGQVVDDPGVVNSRILALMKLVLLALAVFWIL